MVNDGDSTSPSDGVTLVTGGSPNNITSVAGGIHSTLATCTGDLTFSFDLKLTSAGNNNKSHAFSFFLMNGGETLQSLTYNSKTGDNLLSVSSSINVQMTFTAEEVSAMRDAGIDQDLVFLTSTDSVTGSNQGVLMSNFQLSGRRPGCPGTGHRFLRSGRNGFSADAPPQKINSSYKSLCENPLQAWSGFSIPGDFSTGIRV